MQRCRGSVESSGWSRYDHPSKPDLWDSQWIALQCETARFNILRPRTRTARQAKNLTACSIGLDSALDEVEDAVGSISHGLVVGHHDDGLALLVEFIEDGQDSKPGLAV